MRRAELPARDEARVYVRTFGCAHNASDSEYMAGVLAAEGFDVSVNHGDAASADAWVINSCRGQGPVASGLREGS